ncbi:MAG: hypothetical protein AB1500_03150 [Bacillota bacterium]
MISLDDLKWAGLRSNYGTGERVAQLLRRVKAGEPPEKWYEDLFQEVCHQHTVSEAAHTALPCLAALAEQRPEHQGGAITSRWLVCSLHAAFGNPADTG